MELKAPLMTRLKTAFIQTTVISVSVNQMKKTLMVETNRQLTARGSKAIIL